MFTWDWSCRLVFSPVLLQIFDEETLTDLIIFLFWKQTKTSLVLTLTRFWMNKKKSLYLWLFIWKTKPLTGDQSCSLIGLANSVILQYSPSDKPWYVKNYFSFLIDATMKLECSTRPGTGFGFSCIDWTMFNCSSFVLKGEFVSLYNMISCFELTRSKIFSI
jgi:hypothetical protein